jgi:Fibronectin type III domain
VESPHSPTLGRRCLSILRVALALSAAACGDEGVVRGHGTATLTWTAVTQKANGAPLTDLAGYKVRYGPTPGCLNRVVVLQNPRATTYVVTNLRSGTWYFTVAAYTRDGLEGIQSNVREKTIP